ncbi:hypothetical protein [Corallococcus exercitus]|uniref:Uncharacterized protein n=1 Tax=Corallococcus exercitus TaxID=2316736 RepID=A0A7Y4JWW0_9BACT|nr:hypothetical protein [Corallococcus exercitus]NOK12288.1 hypothetical protein [Corallococcus exercitus]
MPDETYVEELSLTCGERMITATDGTPIPVPTGAIGGIYDAHGREVWISEKANAQAFPYGNGYQVVVNSAPTANSEAEELFTALRDESLQTLVEDVLMYAAPKVLKIGLSVLGVVGDVLTTSRLTHEIFIRGEYDGVPVTYCLLV